MLRELDSRRLDTGEAIVLLWDDASNTLELTVEGPFGEARRSAPLSPESALDAFRHPFLYVERGAGTAS